MIKKINNLFFKDLSALRFSLNALLSRLASGIAQLYAIRIFLSNHTENEYSVIILLLGFLPVFLLFEFGIAQTIQNKFNQREISAAGIIKISIIHYLILIIIGLFVANSQIPSSILLGDRLLTERSIENFSIGAALLILTSNNLIIQRLLIILKRGYIHNRIILIQSVLQIIGLYVYSKTEIISQLNSIVIYISPIIVVSLIILLILVKKIISKENHRKHLHVSDLTKTSSSFLFLNIMSALLLAVDYFFLSIYGDPEEIVSYHIVTRFFFISYVVYVSYLTYAAKKISNIRQYKQINIIKLSTIIIGLSSVIAIFFLLLLLKETNYISLISIDSEISYLLITTGLIYYMIRVIADINIVLTYNLSDKLLTFKLYLIEILIAAISMNYLLPIYGGPGIFVSLSIAYIVGILYFWQARKI